jgi:hypothetical protein
VHPDQFPEDSDEWDGKTQLYSYHYKYGTLTIEGLGGYWSKKACYDKTICRYL